MRIFQFTLFRILKTNVMKNIYYLCLISIIIIGCGGQRNEKITIDTPSITEIKIINKVSCSHAHLTKKEVIVEDKGEIEEIINLIKHSTNIKTRLNTKVNYGFFDIILLDSDNNKYYYDILYTVYDGVILTDLNGSGKVVYQISRWRH